MTAPLSDSRPRATDALAATAGAAAVAPRLVDPFGRAITYLRLSVTDRCNFRCVYCMAEKMTFLPHAEVLRLEELDRLCAIFIGLGVRKIRLTGGEPLVRRGVMNLVQSLSRRLNACELDELTLTTNGSQLAQHAGELAACGVKRVNVSLDTLDAATFAAISRRGALSDVLAGVEAADRAGLKVKINAVAQKGLTEESAVSLVRWAHGRGYDLTFIEVMPLGDVEGEWSQRFLSLTELRAQLAERLTLAPTAYRSSGPARYWRVEETGGRIGFITPMTHSFCDSCNRVRVACSGRMYLCLGNEGAVDLGKALRESDDDRDVVAVIRSGVARKPKGHAFGSSEARTPRASDRSISLTGG
ncbi:MAG: GTP 3',8-cyclase MoaA [Roseiarcus sp.]|jgi:cyclic pyranopterin phosphate synthase